MIELIIDDFKHTLPRDYDPKKVSNIKLHCFAKDNTAAINKLKLMLFDRLINGFKVTSDSGHYAYNDVIETVLQDSIYTFKGIIGKLQVDPNNSREPIKKELEYLKQKLKTDMKEHLDHKYALHTLKLIDWYLLQVMSRPEVEFFDPDLLKAFEGSLSEFEAYLADFKRYQSYSHTTIYLTEEQWDNQDLAKALKELNDTLELGQEIDPGTFRYKPLAKGELKKLLLTIGEDDRGIRVEHTTQPEELKRQEALCYDVIKKREAIDSKIKVRLDELSADPSSLELLPECDQPINEVMGHEGCDSLRNKSPNYLSDLDELSADPSSLELLPESDQPITEVMDHKVFNSVRNKSPNNLSGLNDYKKIGTGSIIILAATATITIMALTGTLVPAIIGVTLGAISLCFGSYLVKTGLKSTKPRESNLREQLIFNTSPDIRDSTQDRVSSI